MNAITAACIENLKVPTSHQLSSCLIQSHHSCINSKGTIAMPRRSTRALVLVAALVVLLVATGGASVAQNDQPTSLDAALQRIAVLEDAIAQRDQLVATQEALLNAYRCLFSIDTHIVPGGCPATGTPGNTGTPPTGTPPSSVGNWEFVADENRPGGTTGVNRAAFGSGVETEAVPGSVINSGGAPTLTVECGGHAILTFTDKSTFARMSIKEKVPGGIFLITLAILNGVLRPAIGTMPIMVQYTGLRQVVGSEDLGFSLSAQFPPLTTLEEWEAEYASSGASYVRFMVRTSQSLVTPRDAEVTFDLTGLNAARDRFCS